MQYNTRKTLINIIFVFLVLLGITGSWFLFYTNSVIQNSQTYVSYIFDIRRLNDEIDTRMGENTTIVNFDAVNRKLNEMTDKLNAVANYPGFYDFFLIRSNRAIFRNFEKAILAKKAMLEEYKTVMNDSASFNEFVVEYEDFIIQMEKIYTSTEE